MFLLPKMSRLKLGTKENLKIHCTILSPTYNMKTDLIHIPSKKTEELNWSKPLGNYLRAIYGSTTEFQTELTEFNKTRQDIRGVNADNTGLKLYLKYYSELELVDLRFSFESISSHKKINFVWYDAFQINVSHTQSAIAFEKASVLFNIASILSKIGVNRYEQSQRGDSGPNMDDGIKEALQMFQQAAGVLQFLNENFLHAPSNDLSSPVVKFLIKLMLAQSQEIFLLKVISGDLEQKKNSLIAKLCISASNYYSECFNALGDSDEVESNLDDFAMVDTFADDEADTEFYNDKDESQKASNVDPLYNTIMNLKSIYYESLSYYFQGLHQDNQKHYGEAIAYVSQSSKILNEIPSSLVKRLAKSSSHNCYDLIDNMKYQREVIGIKLDEMNKDNDLIYHDIVPSATKLESIKPMDGVKIIPINKIDLFNEINEQNYANFFSNVVPINIHELLSYYSEEKSQLLRNELDLVEVSNEEAASALEALGMPKAVVELKEIIRARKTKESFNGTDIEVEDDIKQIADEVGSNYEQISAQKFQILKMKNQIYSTINECDSIFAKGFTDMDLKEELRNLKKSLVEASSSDNKLNSLISENDTPLYAALSRGSDSSEFFRLFKTGKASDNSTKTPDNEISLLDIDISEIQNKKSDTDLILDDIKSIENINHDLNVTKSQKSKLVNTLKAEIHKDDISDILILNSKVKSTNEIKNVIFEEELKKFSPFTIELDKLVQREKGLIEDLESRWSKLLEKEEVRKIESSALSEKRMIQHQSERIRKFYGNWKRYAKGIAAGADFYQRLLAYAQRLKDAADSAGQNNVPQTPPPPRYQSSYPAQATHFSPNLSRTSTGQSSSMEGYARPPPALPPKEKSFVSLMQQLQINNQSTSPLNQTPPAKSTSPYVEPSGGLIYNQPSTYQPNMYNYFSNQ